jgi:hypothetical protein
VLAETKGPQMEMLRRLWSALKTTVGLFLLPFAVLGAGSAALPPAPVVSHTQSITPQQVAEATRAEEISSTTDPPVPPASPFSPIRHGSEHVDRESRERRLGDPDRLLHLLNTLRNLLNKLSHTDHGYLFNELKKLCDAVEDLFYELMGNSEFLENMNKLAGAVAKIIEEKRGQSRAIELVRVLNRSITGLQSLREQRRLFDEEYTQRMDKEDREFRRSRYLVFAFGVIVVSLGVFLMLRGITFVGMISFVAGICILLLLLANLISTDAIDF